MEGRAAPSAAAQSGLSALSEAVRDFYAPGGAVPVVDARATTPSEFHDRFVAKNRPAILEHACDDWPAMSLWRGGDAPAYLKRRGMGRSVTADLTPSGLGDAAVAVGSPAGTHHHAMFVRPFEARMPFGELVDRVAEQASARRKRAGPAGDDLADARGTQSPAGLACGRDAAASHPLEAASADGRTLLLPAVPCRLEGGTDAPPAAPGAGSACDAALPPPPGAVYFSRQCDCLRDDDEAGFLARPDPARPADPPDVPPRLAFAGEALRRDGADAEPDAVNLWIGSGSATTSAHSDFYENFYVVVSGSKTFTLCPPTDVAFLAKPALPVGAYHLTADGASWCVRADADAAPTAWIAPDVARLGEAGVAAAYPLSAHASPVTVTVREGQCLYLPAMWVHRVAQSGFVVAVNYWYDMEFDHRYVAMMTAAALGQAIGSRA